MYAIICCQMPKFCTPTLGSVAISNAGHDKGKLYIIVKLESEEFVYLADGVSKKTTNPKKKRVKHINMLQAKICEKSLTKLLNGKLSDNEIHKFLKNVNG